jgi:hypothetical protein
MLFYGGWGSRHTGMYELMNQCRFVYIFNFRMVDELLIFSVQWMNYFPDYQK